MHFQQLSINRTSTFQRVYISKFKLKSSFKPYIPLTTASNSRRSTRFPEPEQRKLPPYILFLSSRARWRQDRKRRPRLTPTLLPTVQLLTGDERLADVSYASLEKGRRKQGTIVAVAVVAIYIIYEAFHVNCPSARRASPKSCYF